MINEQAGLDDPQIYSNMQVNEPFKRYKKSILGQLFCFYINPFTGKLDGILMKGNPKKNEEGCYFETWSLKEDLFFRKQNAKHFSAARIVEVTNEQVNEKEVSANTMTDEDMEILLNSRGFLKLQNKLNQMTAISTVDRLLTVAEALEKSEKIQEAIKKRLSELQELSAKGRLQED